ncbi:hypothetical protein B0H13DRAFT_1971684 [Mycena leptocephala]|nr:hypothetical protein B0H13DRAFT_1971684 [Mycena leptocephala]
MITTPAPATSLLHLPAELLHEIVLHYRYSFSFLCPLVRQEDAQQRQERRHVLRSMSQVCSVLRIVSVPLLWERFDVTRPNWRKRGWQSEIAPLIFPHIRSVHIFMHTWSRDDTETLCLSLLEFLHALPNLAGMELRTTYEGFLPILTAAFADAALPTVTALSIPEWLHTIFPAFPNIRTLACPSIDAVRPILGEAKVHFPHLEALAGVRFYERQNNENFIAALSRDFPRLRALSVGNPLPLEFEPLFPRLRALTHLNELAFFHAFVFAETTLPLETLIAGGRDVLGASQSASAKMLTVWTDDGNDGPRLVHMERC